MRTLGQLFRSSADTGIARIARRRVQGPVLALQAAAAPRKLCGRGEGCARPFSRCWRAQGLAAAFVQACSRAR